ncbi:MAG: hypothetical protein K5657_02610 [Desulfovibrio sp.]|nr:hypothetical protein [Desulfovibrio sp.]
MDSRLWERVGEACSLSRRAMRTAVVIEEENHDKKDILSVAELWLLLTHCVYSEKSGR